MAQSRQMSRVVVVVTRRGTGRGDNRPLVRGRFYDNESGAWLAAQASPGHKDHSQQVRYCGRLPGAEAASVCDSTIIHQDA